MVLSYHRFPQKPTGNRRYVLGPDQGFLICPGLVNTYFADKKDPWKYVWLEFGGLRAEESLGAAGLGPLQPIYQPGPPALLHPPLPGGHAVALFERPGEVELVGIAAGGRYGRR